MYNCVYKPISPLKMLVPCLHKIFLLKELKTSIYIPVKNKKDTLKISSHMRYYLYTQMFCQGVFIDYSFF